jgi:hypothetical protein
MPAWAWWGLISSGLFAVGWLCGRLRRPQGSAGHGTWDTSCAFYFSPNGRATRAILAGIRGAKRPFWCRRISGLRRGWRGHWCVPTNGASRCT